MGLSILQHGGRFVLWSSVVDAPVTSPMDENELRITCTNEGWDAHDIDDAIARAKDTGISSRLVKSLKDLIDDRIGLVENQNADLEEGEEPQPVPTYDELIAKYFAEDGHRSGTVHASPDGFDLIVRTAEQDGSGVREYMLGMRDGEIAIVASDASEGLAIDVAGLEPLINALIRLRPAVSQGEELRAEFLRIVDNDVHGLISSDVDGLKGTYGLRDGAVVRIHGAYVETYHGTVEDLLRIEADGAYSVGKA